MLAMFGRCTDGANVGVRVLRRLAPEQFLRQPKTQCWRKKTSCVVHVLPESEMHESKLSDLSTMQRRGLQESWKMWERASSGAYVEAAENERPVVQVPMRRVRGHGVRYLRQVADQQILYEPKKPRWNKRS